MYQAGDTVVYAAHGVCKIQDIVSKNFGEMTKEYYVLKPVYDTGATIFVPVNNEKLRAKMRCTLSEEEIYQIIKSMPDEDTIWIDNDNARKEAYKKIMENGDRSELVRMVKTLHFKSEQQREKGKRLHVADETFLRDAEKVLYDEFALVLDIKRDEVRPFIMNQIQASVQ